MATNLEFKANIDSLKKIKSYLKNLGAEFKGTLNQKDVYFKNERGLLKLRLENGKAQLIFYNRDEGGKDRWSDYFLLPLDYRESERFLGRIFEIDVTVEKSRLLYLYDNTRIHLDHVKELGNYLELETLVLKGKKDSLKRFNYIKKVLHLDNHVEIRESYRDLIKKLNYSES